MLSADMFGGLMGGEGGASPTGAIDPMAFGGVDPSSLNAGMPTGAAIPEGMGAGAGLMGGGGGLSSPKGPAKNAAMLMLKEVAAPMEMADPKDLTAVLASLLNQERYAEALACQNHSGAAGKLKEAEAAKAKAIEDDDLEVAMDLKKNVIPSLKAQVVPEATVVEWSKSSPTIRTIGQMTSAAENSLGKENAAPFVAKCCSADLRGLASSGNLQEASRLHAIATCAFNLLAELPVEKQTALMQTMAKALVAVKGHLSKASSAIAARPSAGERERTQAQSLLAASAELKKLGARLASSLEYHSGIFAPPAVDAAKAILGGSIAPASEVAAEMSKLVQSSHAAVGAAYAQEPAEEASKYLAASDVPLSERCALSLLPLNCEAFPELPATVSLPEGTKMHAPCANVYVRLDGAPAA